MRAVGRKAEALVMLSIAWLLVFVLPFRFLARRIGAAVPSSHGEGMPSASVGTGLALARRVEQTAPLFPRKSTCLVKALALWLLLRRRGIASFIRLGVRRHDGKFEAHAWLLVDGVSVIGGDGQDFTVIADLGARSAGRQGSI